MSSKDMDLCVVVDAVLRGIQEIEVTSHIHACVLSLTPQTELQMSSLCKKRLCQLAVFGSRRGPAAATWATAAIIAGDAAASTKHHSHDRCCLDKCRVRHGCDPRRCRGPPCVASAEARRASGGVLRHTGPPCWAPMPSQVWQRRAHGHVGDRRGQGGSCRRRHPRPPCVRLPGCDSMPGP